MSLIARIKYVIAHKLPGEDAHLDLSPLGRKKSSEAMEKAVNPRESAVAIVLFESENGIETILIQRPIYKGNHSGQVCFPGGKMDADDQDYIDTALRECSEEVGIKPDELDHLGALTPIYIPVSNHFVQPHVFFHPSQPKTKPDPREVDEIFTFPLDYLLDKKRLKRTQIPLPNGRKLEDVPYFDIHKKIVWGATAIILNEFKEVLKRSISEHTD